MDDLIISSNDLAVISTFKHYLSSCFHIKDLGALKYFLGIDVARNAEIYLCKRKYTLYIIFETGNLSSKLVLFPMESNHKLA